jgi:hypothetical protein
MCTFLRGSISAHVDGISDEQLQSESVETRKLHKQRASAYSRPLDPRNADFPQSAGTCIKSLARTLQVHVHSGQGCLSMGSKGNLKCKRHAPWDLADIEKVDENGKWSPKRTCGMLNNWNNIVLLATRANNDIKMLTNGSDTRDVSWYTTKYAVKRQAKSCNMSALLARKLAYNRTGSEETNSNRQANKRLIAQCVYTLSRDQELSSQQVVSYIMGWGDRYLSHCHVPIYWTAVISELRKRFPSMESNSEEKSPE